MGYGFYFLRDGRPAGYCVQATCDRRGCHAEIDRGLGYLCGSPMGADGGCGLYFCPEHLGSVGERGGCKHRGGPWGRLLSCMAAHVTFDPDHPARLGWEEFCLYRAGHDGQHEWELKMESEPDRLPIAVGEQA
jgi:hypothetical protein